MKYIACLNVEKLLRLGRHCGVTEKHDKECRLAAFYSSMLTYSSPVTLPLKVNPPDQNIRNSPTYI